MAIVQISKIIHRTGDILDLPQLDEGELGFSTDSKQLFIGNNPDDSNIDNYGKKHTEILTGESPLYFSQFSGSQDTTLNISNNVASGQLLVVANVNNILSWTNRGGNAGGQIDLGTASNVKIKGGLPGYVLQTDGGGNLTWTTNGVLKYEIHSVSTDDPALVTIKTSSTVVNHNLTTGSAVTIHGVQGMTQLATSGTNGTNRYYVRYVSETTFSLWTDPSTTNEPVPGSQFDTSINDTGFVIGYIVDPTGATPLGANTSVQFNDAGSFGGNSWFTYNKTTGNVGITTNLNVGHVFATSLNGEGGNISNIQGANVSGTIGFANVAYHVDGANVNGNVSTALTAYSVAGGNVTGIVANADHANLSDVSNLALSINGANVTGNVANADHSSVSDVSNLALSINGANVTGEVPYAQWANGAAGSTITGQVSNSLVAGTVYTNAQPNITSVGTLANLHVGNTSTATQVDVLQVLSSTNKLFVSTDTNGVSMLTRTNQNGSGLYFLDSSRYVMVMIGNATTGAATTVATFQGGGLVVNGAIAGGALSGSTLTLSGQISYTPIFGSFYSNVSQSITSANTALVITLNNNKNTNGVSVASNSRITFTRTANVNIQFSSQISKTGGGVSEIDVWLSKNGTNVPETNSTVSITQNQPLIASWNFVEGVTAGDYYELFWSSADTTVSMLASAAKTNPTRPETPSIIVTVTPVGA